MPSINTFPVVVAVMELLRRSNDAAVTDLPEPLSPTMPRVSPASRSNDTSFTARTTPSGVEKETVKLRTDRTALLMASESSHADRARHTGCPPERLREQ